MTPALCPSLFAYLKEVFTFSPRLCQLYHCQSLTGFIEYGLISDKIQVRIANRPDDGPLERLPKVSGVHDSRKVLSTTSPFFRLNILLQQQGLGQSRPRYDNYGIESTRDERLATDSALSMHGIHISGLLSPEHCNSLVPA